MTVYREDRSFGDITTSGRLRLAVFLPQYAETDGGGKRPVSAEMVEQVILDNFVTGLGVRLNHVRQPTSHGAVDVLNSGVFDTILFEINGGREQ